MKKLMDMAFGIAALAAFAWMCLVTVNAQALLGRGEARSFAEAVAVAARMPLV